MNIAYFVPLYPSVSLTFVAREIRQLEKLKNLITVFAYDRADEDLFHPEFVDIQAKVIYRPPLAQWKIIKIIWANISVAIKNPKGYFKAFRWLNEFSTEKNIAKLGLFLQMGYFSYLIRQLSIERIHAHFAIEWAITAMLTSWIADLPFSITTHGADILANPQPNLLPHLFSQTNPLVTISKYNQEFLLDSFSNILQPERVVVVHCGVDINNFCFRPYRKSTDDFSIVTIARLVEKKGHTILIEALDLLKQQGFKFSWIVVGRGPMSSLLEELVKANNLADHTKFLGAAVRDEIQAVLRNADLMVLPCIPTSKGDIDGIPVTLMEAMAMGVPVISTNISGIPELIAHEESGWLVPPNDSKALADRLRQVIEQPNLQQIVLKAREKIETDFNIEIEATRLLSFFQDGL
jgi:glycosyltransferase involved in cell wall biosynthesis